MKVNNKVKPDLLVIIALNDGPTQLGLYIVLLY